MKLAASTFAFGVIPFMAFAQPVTGPYVSFGGGVNLQQNEQIKPASPSQSVIHHYSFDPGFSGAASLGYGLGNGLRAEIEGDFLDNVVRGYGPTPTQRRAGGVEQKYGGFANALYDFDLGLPFYSYVGAGAGWQEVAHLHFNESTIGFQFPVPEGSQTNGAFAYQGIAGFALPLLMVAGLSLTAEYRFIGIGPIGAYHGIRYDSTYPLGIPGTSHVKNDFNHSVLLGARYALFQPPPPPPPVQSAPPPAPPVPQASRTYLVFFDWDRADLTVRARQTVGEAALVDKI